MDWWHQPSPKMRFSNPTRSIMEHPNDIVHRSEKGRCTPRYYGMCNTENDDWLWLIRVDEQEKIVIMDKTNLDTPSKMRRLRSLLLQSLELAMDHGKNPIKIEGRRIGARICQWIPTSEESLQFDGSPCFTCCERVSSQLSFETPWIHWLVFGGV